MSDTGPFERQRHGDGDPLGQLLKLDDFGGDLHFASMCKLAQKSSAAMCAVAESVRAHFRAQLAAMATQPKSQAVKEYRREIGRYLKAVQIATDWKLVRMGKMAGGLAHTTISRAMKGEHTMGYPALLALEAASAVPIPPELTAAARNAQQPSRAVPDLSEETLRDIGRQLSGKSKKEQQAIIADLLKALTETG